MLSGVVGGSGSKEGTMTELSHQDLQWALRRTPKALRDIMQQPAWRHKIFVGGGFLRSTVAGDPVNDVDVFVQDKDAGLRLAAFLVSMQKNISWTLPDVVERCKKHIHVTDNAYTLTCFSPAIQIIHRWVFNDATAVSNSFDFTCCCAAFYFDEGWSSVCDDRFYPDIAAKRLVYRSPIRNEDAGGSMLRVLKYYQKGYRIPLDSLGAVIARLVSGLDFENSRKGPEQEAWVAKVITGLLRVVDPLVDPMHEAHLPSETEIVDALEEAQ
jgi:hypothetical protein